MSNEVLEDIIEAFPGFLTNEDVNGGDLVDFVGGMIARYEENRPRPPATCPDCKEIYHHSQKGQTCRGCGRGVIE